MLRMKIVLFVGMLIAVSPIIAVDVDRQELSGLEQFDITFRNYTGAQTSVDRLQDIIGLGRGLGSVDWNIQQRSGSPDRYEVIHAVDDLDDGLLDADILSFGANARIDHIDNVRRIIAGYLNAAYLYSEDDGSTLATLATIYNAIHRSDIEFFASRYSDLVVSYLEEGAAGLSTDYSDWPGATQIVIPLTPDAAPGQADTIDLLPLASDEVIEQLRSADDLGIDDRQDTVDLLDRALDQRQEQASRRSAELEEEQQRLDEQSRLASERAAELERERQQLEADPSPSPEERQRLEQIADEQRELTAEQTEIDSARAELTEVAEDIRQDERRIDQLEEATQVQRESIAEDTRQLLSLQNAARGRSVLFPIASGYRGYTHSRLARIGTGSGESIQSSELDSISSRQITTIGDDFLVIAQLDGKYRLVVLDETALTTVVASSNEVHPQSTIIIQGNDIFAIFRQGGQWHLGRFGADMSLQAASASAVMPLTHVVVVGRLVYFQNSEGEVRRADRARLTDSE